MAVTAYALDGMTVERAAELGVDFPPNWLPVPASAVPCVGLYSERLNQWSELYVDDGAMTSDAWLGDVLYQADAADQTADTLQGQLDTDLAANIVFLARATFPSAAIADQVKALTRQIDTLIRIERALLDSTTGT